MLRKLSKNTTWDDIRPSKYLKAEDLPEDGSILSVTVAGMSEQEMGKDKQVKWVMEFEELVKDLVFNNKVNFDMAKTVTGAKKPIEYARQTYRTSPGHDRPVERTNGVYTRRAT